MEVYLRFSLRDPDAHHVHRAKRERERREMLMVQGYMIRKGKARRKTRQMS